MLWKCGWSLLATSNQIIRTLPSLAFRFYSSTFLREDETQRLNSGLEFPHKSKVILTGHIVHSTLSKCPSDLIALSFFLWCAQQHNYFHDAAAFDCMVGPVRRLTERCKTVKGILLELQSFGCVIKAKTFLLLLRIYWRGEMHAMVFEAYEEMESYGFAPNTFVRNVIMDVLFKINRTDLALKALRENRAPNFLTFSIALHHLSKLNDIRHTKHVVTVMLRMGYYPNAGAFEMLLNCFCKMNRLVEASQVLGLMIALGITISVNVWTILINGFCKSGRLGIASNLLKKMAKTGCAPNVVTYTILFKALMQSKMITDAFGLLITMESCGHIPDLILYNVLIDCLSKVGRYQDALEVFITLSKQNIAPDSYTFSSLLSTICLSRRFYLVPKLLPRLFMDSDLVFCNALLSYFAKAGLPSLAVEFYDVMIDWGFTPDKYSFTGLLGALCAAKRIEEAVNVYHGIVMNYQSIDAHIHTVIIDGLIKVGEYSRAIRIFRKVILEKYPLDGISYIVGIRGLLRSGRTQEACALFDQMKEDGLTPNVYTCNLMLSAFCKEKNSKMVNQMLREMIHSRVELSNGNLFNLCKHRCRSNTYFLLFDLLVEMRDLGLLPAKALHDLCFDGDAENLQPNYEHYTVSTEPNLVIDSCSSEDLSDVAASIC